jgi:RNA polymerase sigma-70 factor, ECF subfamily
MEPDCAEPVVSDALLEGLDTDRRTAFVLTQLLVMSYEESARVRESPVGTIRSRVARARTGLIAVLSESQPSEAPESSTA